MAKEQVIEKTLLDENEQEVVEEHKMGVMPIPRLLIFMSLPMIASMMVQALYNIVDSIFVSRLGENALTAVSLSYPYMTLLIALGVGTAVGVNALISRNLGAKHFNEANSIATHGLLLPLISIAIFMLTAQFLVPWYFHFQTSDPEIYELGIQYLRITVLFSGGLMYQIMSEKMLSATGRTGFTMITQITGALINVALDPILIFGLLGAPALGVRGAAIATVTGQTIAAITGLAFNFLINKDIKFQLQGFRPSFRQIRAIYKIGLPSIIMPTTGALMTFFINNILISFTSTANAVFGIYFNLQSFVFMPIFGLNNGMVPIVSYNFGALKKDRIMKTVRLAMTLAVVYMSLGFLLFQFFPSQLLGIFDANPEMLAIGIRAFRIISFHFLLAGISIIISATSQALGYGHYSITIAVIRQLLVLIPSFFILGKIFGLEAVWFAYPIAEICALLTSITLFKRLWRKEGLAASPKLAKAE